jgi:hypothetical protein
LQALEEIAEMVGESEEAVGEILEATLPTASTASQEVPKKSGDGFFPSGPDSFFEQSQGKADLQTGNNDRSSGPVTVPTLVMGADDIFWVSTLHAALNEKGYYCGEEEEEDMYFGDGTFSALVTFQVLFGQFQGILGMYSLFG